MCRFVLVDLVFQCPDVFAEMVCFVFLAATCRGVGCGAGDEYYLLVMVLIQLQAILWSFCWIVQVRLWSWGTSP